MRSHQLCISIGRHPNILTFNLKGENDKVTYSIPHFLQHTYALLAHDKEKQPQPCSYLPFL